VPETKIQRGLTPHHRSVHRPTDLLDGGPNYADLYAEGCFAQRPFINAGKLRTLAQDRGLYLPLFPRRDILEPFDAAGAFSPIAFRQTNYSGETTWLRPDPSQFVWREEMQPRPWDVHAWEPGWSGDPRIVSECYSPWQLLYLPNVLEETTLSIGARTADAGLDQAQIKLQAQAQIRRWQRLDEQWRPFIKLLIALQPRFWPYRAHRTTLLYESGTSPERIDPLRLAHSTFDASKELSRFSLSLEDVAWLHYGIAEQAQRLDPAPHLYRLLDRAPRRRNDLLRGEALRARDLYDAAFMLRGLYFAGSNDWLPEPDEIDDVDDDADGWNRRHLPRQQQPENRSRLQLKPLLIREGLYPHLIHFFVEGQTEEIVLKLLLSFLDFSDDSGMTITNIHGIDKAKRYGVLFNSATQYATRTVFVGDREGEIDRTLKQLQKAGVFSTESDVLLWEVDGHPSSFEEANFTFSEMVRAMAAAAGAEHPDVELRMTPDDLESEFQQRLSEAVKDKASRPALGKIALQLAGEDRCGNVHLGKTDLAPHLAEVLIDVIKDADHVADVSEAYPLIRRLGHWIVTTR
jgi:hypothetical protein